MNVTIICEVLGEPKNGTSVAAYNLINSLKAKGHKVTVVCPDQNRKGEEGYVVLPIIEGIPVISRMFEENQVILPKFDRKIVADAIQDADVVHIMIPLFISRKASKLVKEMGKPLTAGFHAQAENFSSHLGGLVHSKWVNHLVYKWYDGNVFCRADAIHYPTQFIRDVFEAEIGRTTPGYVISNGIPKSIHKMETQKPAEFKDKFCILFTGRYSPEKNHSVLIEAVKKSKYQDKIQLIFAGDGPDRKKIEKMSASLSNKPVLGFVSREELNKIVNYCDLYCHPATMELEGISCLEAISCGLVPMISDSRLSATKNFALDKHCLFQDNNSDDLASKIDWFIEHPAEKAKLSEKYLASKSSYDQDECMDKMEKMLLKAAGLQK